MVRRRPSPPLPTALRPVCPSVLVTGPCPWRLWIRGVDGRERLRPSLGHLVRTLGCGDRVGGFTRPPVLQGVAHSSFSKPSRFLIFFSKTNNTLAALFPLLTQNGF